jgi:uncharacterized protein (TIRG00374 family)
MDLGALGARRNIRRARASNWKAWRMPAVGVFVSLILIVIYAHLVDVPSIFARLGHLNIGLALLCGAAFLSAYAVRALRWRLFLAPHAVSMRRAVAIYQVATFINVLLPVQGGELVKSLLLRRLNGIPISESLPTVAMDKMLDLLPAVGLLVLLPFLPLQVGGALWMALLIVLVLLGLGVGCIGLAAWRRATAYCLLANVTARLPRRLRQRTGEFVTHFIEALLALVARPRRLLIAACITAVAVCLDALYCFLAFRAVGAQVPVLLVLFGYTLFNLCSILPSPPGQVGSVELIGLLVFNTVLHVDRSTVATALLFDHPWTIFLLVTTGLLSLSALGVSLRAALSLERESAVADKMKPARASSVDGSPRRANGDRGAARYLVEVAALVEQAELRPAAARGDSRTRAMDGDETYPGSERVLARR